MRTTKSIKTKDTKTKPIKKTPKGKTLKRKTLKRKPSKSTTTLPKPEGTIVLMYANWCPHCNSMKGDWNELKRRLGPMVVPIEIEDSEPTESKQTKMDSIRAQFLNGEDIEMYGYPTIFKIQNGRPEYYGGNRTADEMYNWVKGNNYGGYNKSKIRKTNTNSK